MSIDNREEKEFRDRVGEVDELDLDVEDEGWDLDMSEEEDDVSLVSDLFRQISQENTVDRDVTATADRESSDLFPMAAVEIEETPIAAVPKPQKGYLIGLGVAIALGIGGLIAVSQSNRQLDPATTVTSLPATELADQTENFQNIDTPELTRIASQKFKRGDVNGATRALETLLDRNALPEAKQVISAIPPNMVDTAQVSFLRGRSIWQSATKNQNIAAIQAARQYWQEAVKKNPNSVLYGNALGFAYYAEGNFNQAIGAWFGAISGTDLPASPGNDELAEKQVLNNYAGIALALWRVADTQPSAQKQELTREAIKLGKKVIAQGKANFNPDRLSQDWMWSKTAIDDWQSFLQQESVIK